MKTVTCVSIDSAVHAAMKQHAASQRLSVSGLIERAMIALLDIEPTAEQQGLSAKEQAIMDAQVRIVERRREIDPGSLDPAFTMKELAKSIGGYPSTLLPTLRKLEKRGLLISETMSDLEAATVGIDRDVEVWLPPRAFKLSAEGRARLAAMNAALK